MIRVLMIDDHDLVRAGFRLILTSAADIDVVGEAGTAEAGIELARRLKPNVVLMDLNLPGMSGIEATERLTRSDGGPKVIALTMQDQPPFPKRMLEVGALGFLNKGCPADELIAAVRAVAEGKRYLGAQIAQAMALESINPAGSEAPFQSLSARELEVAIAIAQGQSMPEIAKRMALSPKTVATYKYRVYEKLGVTNEVALASLAARYGIVLR